MKKRLRKDKAELQALADMAKDDAFVALLDLDLFEDDLEYIIAVEDKRRREKPSRRLFLENS